MQSATALASVTSGTTELTYEDKLDIAAMLQNFERIWNDHQVSELTQLFTEDAECVNITGMWWRGRADIIKALEAFHATIFRTHRLEIRAIAPTIAIATATQGSYQFTNQSDSGMSETLNRLTFVCVKRDGSWLIANAHGTVIDPEAQKQNPIQRRSLGE